MGGCAPPTDADGNLYLMMGNGHYSSSTGQWGQTFLKTKLSNGVLTVVDWFTPFDWQSINTSDLDIGSGCPALLPDQSGAHPHLGGIRTFTLLGGGAGLAGLLASAGYNAIATALVAGLVGLVVVGYAAVSRRHIDATTDDDSVPRGKNTSPGTPARRLI